MGEHLIETAGLSKDYHLGGEVVHAVVDVDLTIAAGEFIAIMGPSGSGKSTFMHLLGCLDKASRGEFWLDQENIATKRPGELALIRNRSIGFVFQSFNLLSRLNALANVEVPLIYARRRARERRRIAREVLTNVGLADRMTHLPTQLSGGQQQRVAIARALVNGPKLILADEPTGALDSRTGIEIMALLQDLNDDGLTVVLVTHEESIALFANRVVRFLDGRIVADGANPNRVSAREQLAELAEDAA